MSVFIALLVKINMVCRNIANTGTLTTFRKRLAMFIISIIPVGTQHITNPATTITSVFVILASVLDDIPCCKFGATAWL